jgi:hypothetical protein
MAYHAFIPFLFLTSHPDKGIYRCIAEFIVVYPPFTAVSFVEETMIILRSFFMFTVLVCMAVAVPALAADWNPLPDTGQTKCYDVAGNEIACPAAGQPLHGQDAQYHGPAPSYTDNGDGTVTDNNTGLVWMKSTADTNTDGSITSDDRLSWQDAIDYCAGLGGGWRLPTYTELESIVDYGRSLPTINPIFHCQSSAYWSASTHADDTNHAWYFYFNFGGDNWCYEANTNYVRCVRAGQ